MNFAANRVSGPARASRNINEALQSSGTNRGAVADAMARNPELMPLDVDPALFARAQGIATQPGPGRGASRTRSTLDPPEPVPRLAVRSTKHWAALLM